MVQKVLTWAGFVTAALTWAGACGLLFLAASFQSHPLWLFQIDLTVFDFTCLLGAPIWAYLCFTWKHRILGFVFSLVLVLFLASLTFILVKADLPVSVFFAFDLFILISLTVFFVETRTELLALTGTPDK